jgi:RND superfamily putative drug exporter
MQEEWQRLRSRPGTAAWRNHAAVTAGQAHSTRIVTAAAGIMILVFGSFLPGGHHLLQEFGFGLGFSVLVDAVLIRSMLLPAVMHLIGPANWYLPARLARALPSLDIEAGEADAPAPAGHREPTRPGA